MKKAARRTTNKKSEAENQIQTTAGEVFADGSVIELVASGSANGHKPALLLWDGEKAVVKPEVEYGGHIYRPPELHASILQAIRLPSGATQYGKIEELLGNIRGLFEQHVGLLRGPAMLLTLWTLSSWFPDVVWSPLPLVVSGPDMGHAIILFLLLSCLCRRPLLLTDITRGPFCSLVMRLQPTLLVNQPDLAPRIRTLWRTSNYHGLFVPGTGGTVVNVACSKAVFLGMEGAADSWSDAALHLALPPAPHEPPPLDEHEQARIAGEYQPRLLMHRLHYLPEVRRSRSPGCELTFPTAGLARNLMACVPHSPELEQTVAPVLQSQEQDILARRLWDPTAAIIEVVWVLLHQAVREASTTHVTELTNTLLRSRGEILTYSHEEIGRKLSDLGLSRSRGRNCMILRFSRELSRHIHLLARKFELNVPGTETCPDCAEQEVVAG